MDLGLWLLKLAALPAVLAIGLGLIGGWNEEIGLFSPTRARLARNDPTVEPEGVTTGGELVVLAVVGIGALVLFTGLMAGFYVLASRRFYRSQTMAISAD